jgi:hypothetical protein
MMPLGGIDRARTLATDQLAKLVVGHRVPRLPAA